MGGQSRTGQAGLVQQNGGDDCYEGVELYGGPTTLASPPRRLMGNSVPPTLDMGAGDDVAGGPVGPEPKRCGRRYKWNGEDVDAEGLLWVQGARSWVHFDPVTQYMREDG